MTTKDQSDRVQSACTKIIIRKGMAFFAVFLVRMKVSRKDSVGTFATDGREIWWSNDFVAKLSDDEIIGVLIHEVCHIICKHTLRFGQRDHRKWNIACDYVIDPMVLDAGLSLPNGEGMEQHHDKQYSGKTAEQVYNLLPDQPKGQGQGGGQGQGEGQGNGIGGVMPMKNDDDTEMSESDKRLQEDLVGQMISIAAQAQKDIGSLPAGIQEIISEAREAQVPWEDKVERFIGGDQPDGHNFSRPSRHQWHHSRLFMPSIHRVGVGQLVCAIDTSASMSNPELIAAFSEVKHLVEEFKPELFTLIYCDTDVQKVEVFERGDEIERLEMVGRGGTRVRPAIKYAMGLDRCDKFIYITDMEFSDAGIAPPFPVLWVGTTRTKPPYGDYCYIKPSH